jgi:trans-AT polyketide synthase/acyltransferase/oxidoreductase domain-containing protein
VIAKVSRPEVAQEFLSPAPERIVRRLLEAGRLTPEQAELGRGLPISDDICVEADSGGHTDQGVALVLMPAMLRLRDDLVARHGYRERPRIGAAGGIGAPQAAAAAFVLGADFILTGSINQCTVEAGTSDAAKDMLQAMNVQDTDYAPAGDMFELGARVQVLKKGLFFPARANKLYELYRRYDSLDQLDEKTARQIQEKYFRRSFDEVWRETTEYLRANLPGELAKAEQNPKYRMSLVFRWYFVHSARLAAAGDPEQRVDYQIQCGPALGAFNEWVRGTPLESWRARHADEIARKLMEETAALLNRRYREMAGDAGAVSEEARLHPAGA